MIMYMQALDTADRKDSFVLMYEKYRNLMFHIAKNILHDDFLAEDAVHDALVAIAKNFEKVHEPVSKETRRYVSTIVRNISLNMAVRRGYETPVDDMTKEDFFMSLYYNSSQDEFLSKFKCEEIVAAVKSLSPSLRDPLMLYCVQAMSSKEIATALNISLSAVHKRIQRAREKILKELGEDYEYIRK